MKYTNCPQGTGHINMTYSYNEAVELLKYMNHVINEFEWDEYILELTRRNLERAITQENERRISLSDQERSELDMSETPMQEFYSENSDE